MPQSNNLNKSDQTNSLLSIKNSEDTPTSSVNSNSQTRNIYFKQSLTDSSSTGTTSSETRSTSLPTGESTTGSRNSSFQLDNNIYTKTLPENITNTNSDILDHKSSQHLLSFSPITPIVDCSNNSGIFSDFSIENISNSQSPNSDRLVYKSVMIIDVLNKLKTTGVKMENPVYINEIKLDAESNNLNAISVVKNIIRKDFNNFYLLKNKSTSCASNLEVEPRQIMSNYTRKFSCKKAGKSSSNQQKRIKKNQKRIRFICSISEA